MAKPEWGAKRTCHNCGARFYDLCREPIVCPVCSTVCDVERQPRARRGGGVSKDESASRPKVSKAAAVAGAVAEDAADKAVAAPDAENLEKSKANAGGDNDGDDVVNINADDQGLIEDTSDLGEDGDDIGEVLEHIDEDVEDKS